MQRVICLFFLSILSLICLGNDYAASQEMRLVSIRKMNPRIKIFMPCYHRKNVFGCQLYPWPKIYLLQGVAYRLNLVQQDLEKEGLGLIVFEGYRPPSVQEEMDCRSCRYTYPDHYRKGMGVDVGIYYLSGQPLDWPTPYNDDSGAASRINCCWPCHVFHTQSLLECAMWKHGFVPMQENWWHFDARGWKQAPFLNCEYEDIEPCLAW